MAAVEQMQLARMLSRATAVIARFCFAWLHSFSREQELES
jgi:hypothetical protein